MIFLYWFVNHTFFVFNTNVRISIILSYAPRIFALHSYIHFQYAFPYFCLHLVRFIGNITIATSIWITGKKSEKTEKTCSSPRGLVMSTYMYLQRERERCMYKHWIINEKEILFSYEFMSTQQTHYYLLRERYICMTLNCEYWTMYSYNITNGHHCHTPISSTNIRSIL